MNKHNKSALRAGTLALALALSSISHAAAPDPAAIRMAKYGSVSVEAVGSVTVGSSVAQVSDVVGSPSRQLPDGRWLLFRDFWIDGSSAHGSLVISFADGKVSSLTVVSHAKGVALCRDRDFLGALQLVARN